MSDIHPTNQVLITILENQMVRTEIAFEGLATETYRAEPGGDCNSLERIGKHLISLRQFQLMLLESPLAEQVPSLIASGSVEELLPALKKAAELVHKAIVQHDPEDWYRVPEPPREGKWGEDPTIIRFARPFNDFTNHLGGVRAIRRIFSCGVEQTQ